MSPIKRLLLGLVLMSGVLAGVAFALPGQVSVARTTVIEAPEADVFAYLNNPEKYVQWSPWAPRDSDTTYKLSGPEEGEGARLEWSSPRAGSGAGEIVASERNAYVRVALDFERLGGATSHYRLAPAGAGTRVTSGFDTEIGANPVQRWRGLLYMRSAGAQIDAGLDRLKRAVEAAR